MSWRDFDDYSRKHLSRDHGLLTLGADYAADGSCWEWYVLGGALNQRGRGCVSRDDAKRAAEHALDLLEASKAYAKSEERREIEKKILEGRARRMKEDYGY
jgi:hypothetical protein